MDPHPTESINPMRRLHRDIAALADGSGDAPGLRDPYLEGAFGWHATGARTDRLDRRPTMTVYYSGPGPTTAGYTIVGGAALPEPSGARVLVSRGTRYLTLTRAGRSIVTWRRAG